MRHLTIEIFELHGREEVGYSPVEMFPIWIGRHNRVWIMQIGPMPSAAPKGVVSIQKPEANTMPEKIHYWLWLYEWAWAKWRTPWHYFSWHPERSNSLWFVFFAFTYKKSASWQLELGIQPEAAIYTPFLFLGHDILLLYSYLTITSSLVSLFRNCSALLNARLEIRIPDVPFLYKGNCIDYSDSSIAGTTSGFAHHCTPPHQGVQHDAGCWGAPEILQSDCWRGNHLRNTY